jgi:hypothetical protein
MDPPSAAMVWRVPAAGRPGGEVRGFPRPGPGPDCSLPSPPRDRHGRVQFWNRAEKSCSVRSRCVMEPGEAAHRSRSESGHARAPGCGQYHMVGAAPGARVSLLNPGKAHRWARLHLRSSSTGAPEDGLRDRHGDGDARPDARAPSPRGTDTGGSNLEQSRKIVSGPLPERDGTG